jgi:small-conductance mechanosensitive channel
MEVPAAAVARYQRSESWIAHLTLILGAIAALLAGFLYSSRWGIGLMIGALLAWLNFRWLRRGADALTETVASERERRKRKIPLLTYFKAAFRYALIALIVYVIFKYLNVPALSMVVGLCALGAATLAVSVHEMLRPQE